MTALMWISPNACLAYRRLQGKRWQLVGLLHSFVGELFPDIFGKLTKPWAVRRIACCSPSATAEAPRVGPEAFWKAAACRLLGCTLLEFSRARLKPGKATSPTGC